jgi:exodeoxyribonuclease VII large subunit
LLNCTNIIKSKEKMENNIISVSELTGAIKLTLEDGFGDVSVTGEISNFKQHSSGHRYFTLKDEGASISCVMWRTRKLDFMPADGMKVIITGSLTVYPPRGNYQIDCTSMHAAGQGELWLAYEALKKKLDAAGYFDEMRKRNLPDMPMSVGIATSPTGAAIRDMFSTIERRFPAMKIYFRPTVVQGDDTGPDVAKAIEELNQYPVDVIIIGRGGGSLEDLWGFNTEIVAEAVYNSEKPIISAVGHETDFSISDFVADKRAATPTAAAELVTPVTQETLQDNLERISDYLKRLGTRNINNLKEDLSKAISEKAKQRVIEKINLHHQFLDDSSWRIKNIMKSRMSSLKQQLEAKTLHCKSLSPYAPLEKGYAIIKANGKVIKKNKSLASYKNIVIERANEKADARIIGIQTQELF